ncbi:MAG: DUF4974 domain-containing protein [Gemmatimonas sp.]|nr:DUF4974 domain-containing protein [Gemmatimonas sp.]
MNDSDREAIISSLVGEASIEELRRVAEWRAGSEENEEVYGNLARLWEASGEIGPDSLPNLPPASRTIIEGARQRDPSGAAISAAGKAGTPTAGTPRRSGWPFRSGPVWAAAGVATLAVGVGLGSWIARPDEARSFGADSFVTGVDEVGTVTLQDETVVRLAPSSRLTILELDDTREVSLVGRAYFAVARDEIRPFRVRLTSGDVVEVLGTRFDVLSRERDIQIAVAEGEVRIGALGSRVDVRANEVATIREGEVPRVERVDDVYQVIDWLGSFLAFESTPLREVADELEGRFGIEIQIVDVELSERTVTGWFADQDPAAIMGGICRVVAADCTLEAGAYQMDLAP